MLGKTHVIGAVATGAATGAAFGLPISHTVAMAGASAVTAKLPDLDRLVNKGPNHRSLTHSAMMAGGGVAGLAYYVCSRLPDSLLGWGFIVPAVVWGLAVGYLSHLILDSFTSKKVPLLFPGGARVGMGVVKTGTTGESAFLALAIVGVGLYLLVSYGAALGSPGPLEGSAFPLVVERGVM